MTQRGRPNTSLEPWKWTRIFDGRRAGWRIVRKAL
jgi:hypothetical protein